MEEPSFQPYLHHSFSQHDLIGNLSHSKSHFSYLHNKGCELWVIYSETKFLSSPLHGNYNVHLTEARME